MRSKLVVPGLLAIALGVAACGSSSSSSSAGASTSTATSSHKAHSKKAGGAGVPSRTYTVKLTGPAETPPGAPHGSGFAIIAIHDSTHRICWRFAHLHGFSGPTFSHIHVGAAGKSGNIVVPLSTGATFEHKGCAPTSASVISAIQKNPHGYYVNIHTKQYPSGAVRAQL
jgi:hypothetical protein